MKKIILTNKEIYHIYNRGVDKRKIFLNSKDYQRFVDGLVVFNDTENLDGRHLRDLIDGQDRKALVNIVAYCLMPNHFHLLLEQIADTGVTKFMKKLTTGYTMYFNKKYERTGALVQGVFKRSHIRTNDRLLEMSRYIHANPLKILPEKSFFALESYRWSSLSDYLGIKAPSLVVNNKKIILDQFKNAASYRAFIRGLTSDK
jgi:putative transposase